MNTKAGTLRRIPDLDGYSVDEYGNVYSHKTRKYLVHHGNCGPLTYKYARVAVQINQWDAMRSVARLVLATFKPEIGITVATRMYFEKIRYIDGNPMNCALSNLDVVDLYKERNMSSEAKSTAQDKDSAKPILGAERYSVDRFGNIYRNGKILKALFVNKTLRLQLYLKDEKGRKLRQSVSVWRIILATFKPELGVTLFGICKKKVVYLDGNHGNCSVDNLDVRPYMNRVEAISKKDPVVVIRQDQPTDDRVPVLGLPMYTVNKMGVVRNEIRNVVMKEQNIKEGGRITFWDKGKAVHAYLRRIVFASFNRQSGISVFGKMADGMKIVHIDGNDRNCDLENLSLVRKTVKPVAAKKEKRGRPRKHVEKTNVVTPNVVVVEQHAKVSVEQQQVAEKKSWIAGIFGGLFKKKA